MGASFCQDDVKKCSSSLKIARNRSNFVARFRSHANMCSNSVPTAALAGVRTLCQQQSQGKCWHRLCANSRAQCANVRTEALRLAEVRGEGGALVGRLPSSLAVRASMPGEPKLLQRASYLEYGVLSLRGRPQQPPPKAKAPKGLACTRACACFV